MSRAERYMYGMEVGAQSSIAEQGQQYTLSLEQFPIVCNEIVSADHLGDVEKVAAEFHSIDWSFYDADTGYLTHGVHPYPAKFIPQIPGHCIALLSMPGEVVLDPFGGSGTTALEAIRMGRRAVSLDANPVGTLIGRVKTCNLDVGATTDLRSIRSALATRLLNLPDPDVLCVEGSDYIPDIPNMHKWFPVTSRGELALIRSRISRMDSENARNIALLALSRIVLASSFQDSETRYSSRPRDIPQGQTLSRFLVALDETIRDIYKTQASLRYGICRFETADTRNLPSQLLEPESVDLIVTSPPYGNANDYHLYHRFRLLWLGYDPRELGKIEIGSHLRHQKESSGFYEYIVEMRQSLMGWVRVLRPGRYAVLVVGDAVYNKVRYSTVDALIEVADCIGFETVCNVERTIHRSKRSFVSAGRRATSENILVLRKRPVGMVPITFQAPSYKLWPFERALKDREIESVVCGQLKDREYPLQCLTIDDYSVTKARKLVFTHGAMSESGHTEPTWQAILENGGTRNVNSRKNSKYVTHGLHPYKGKFYPQLAKALINLCGLTPGARLFDPFCGSGTTLLEAYLNGYESYGCDLNPLAAQIARVKIGILDVPPDVVREAIGSVVSKVERPPKDIPEDWDQFDPICIPEIHRWFAKPISAKLNWLIRVIRSTSDGIVRDYLEAVLSSIIREVSHQSPKDLRVRKRRAPFADADVFGLYLSTLEHQYNKLEKFWSVRGYAPERFCRSHVIEGDSRDPDTVSRLGLDSGSVDLILTSPPYATALPYIDTDRLSLLTLFGMNSSARRPIEHSLVGSREIGSSERRNLEGQIIREENGLTKDLRDYLVDLHRRVADADVGFRRKNMPSLLFRFFQDMTRVLNNCHAVLRPNGQVMIVIGDNRIRVDNDYERIPTTDLLQDVAEKSGFKVLERIDINVTTENMVHIGNAITRNVVLRLSALHGHGPDTYA